MARLLVIKGPDEGKQFDLREDCVAIGRDASNRIRLHDTECSRRHAEIRAKDGGFVLSDLGSANGSFVNNKRIRQALLKPGDHVQIGQSLLVFSIAPEVNTQRTSDLAQRIGLIARKDVELPSGIVKTVSEGEGSRLLARPDDATSAWLKTALANLTIMYEASQTVSHILDLNEMLTRLLELIFRSIPADRGCVMLCQKGPEDLEPRALRWRKESDRQEKIMLSRTIVDHVLQNREGVLLSDAASDSRFAGGQSIHRFGIREVICVPMRGRHETLGVLYLDTQLTTRELAKAGEETAKFNEDHLRLAIAVSHQAALAVEETRYHQAMLEAERLAAIGHTIAALSHHIKNILQGLRSGNEILKMGIQDKNEKLLLQGWRIAEKSQGKIYDLVMDMLNYSKERIPNVEPTNINETVADIVELMTPRTKELGIALEMSLDEKMPRVSVDPEGIHRALLNIVGNALDAVEGHSEPKVTVTTRAGDDGWARIIVLDNGSGIAADKLDEIFKPFVSTKGAKGTGLGLAVSKKILLEHGGDIIVQSQEKVGSKFTLKLPLKSPLQQDLAATMHEIPVFAPPEPD